MGGVLGGLMGSVGGLRHGVPREEAMARWNEIDPSYVRGEAEMQNAPANMEGRDLTPPGDHLAMNLADYNARPDLPAALRRGADIEAESDAMDSRVRDWREVAAQEQALREEVLAAQEQEARDSVLNNEDASQVQALGDPDGVRAALDRPAEEAPPQEPTQSPQDRRSEPTEPQSLGNDAIANRAKLALAESERAKQERANAEAAAAQRTEVVPEQEAPPPKEEAARTLWDGMSKVGRTIYQSLHKIGRWDEEEHASYATLIDTYYHTLAKRLGTTVDALWAKHPLYVTDTKGREGFLQETYTKLPDAMERWKGVLGAARKAAQHAQERFGNAKASTFELRLGVPTVLRTLDPQLDGLRFSSKRLSSIIGEHPNVPNMVWGELPRLVSRAEYAFWNAERESWNVVLPMKVKGEHLIAAFERDGSLNTVYPLEADATGTSRDRLNAKLWHVYHGTEKLYARDGLPAVAMQKAPPEGISAKVRTLAPTPAALGASIPSPVSSRTPAKIVTWERLVKEHGGAEDFYQRLLTRHDNT